MVNNICYEAEDWDRTGGPDPLYPGAEEETIDGRVVADCGNQGDWVEYRSPSRKPSRASARTRKKNRPKP